jgi:hypothetical protein
MIHMHDLLDVIRATYAAADAALQSAGAPVPQRLIVTKRYGLTFAAVAAGQSQTQQLQIGANGDFFLQRFSFIGNANPVIAQTLSASIIPQWRIQITDSGSDELFANVPIDLSNFANHIATGSDHRDEPYPRVITGRSNLSLQVTSYETVTTWNVDFVLTGVLVKSYGTNM